MNENYNPIYEEGKSISVSGLCIYILKKWKVLMIAGLVAAIALGGMSYMESKKKYEQAQNAAASQTQKEVSISDYDKEVVLAKKQLIESHEQIVKEYEHYYTNSIKVRLDPNAVHEGVAAYVIGAADMEELFEVGAVCEGVVFNEEAYKELAGMLSEETEVSMLKEVILFERGYAIERGDEVTVSTDGNSELRIIVRHFNEEDCKTMLAFVEERMEQIPQLLAERNINAVVTKGSVGYGVVVDRSLAPLKKELQTAKITAYETISNTKNNMSDDQKAYYEYLLNQNEETQPQSSQPAEKPKFNLLMVVLGAIAGVAVAAVAYVAQYLFGGRVHNKEELKSWLAVPVLDAEAGSEMLAANLEALASNNQVTKVCLTGSLGQDQNDKMTQLKTLLSKKGIEAVAANSILKDAKAMEAASGCGAVVLVETCDASKEKDVREMVLKASSCGIKVLGVVLEK